MGNLITSLPKTVPILGTDVPFGYVMIVTLAATFIVSGEYRSSRGGCLALTSCSCNAGGYMKRGFSLRIERD